MSGIVLDGNKDTPRKLQELARHQMILKLEKDILTDMIVCKLEGWDQMEFVNMLGDLLDGFRRKTK